MKATEGGHAIGLGPDASTAGAGDMAVVQLDVALAVQRNRDMRSGKFDTQGVPRGRSHWRIDVLDGLTTATLDVVQRDVVLQRIGAGDVIVVGAFPAPDDAACLVLPARQGLEPWFDIAVGD